MGSAVTSIEGFLAHHRVVGADTMVFIYHLEDHPVYSPITQMIFDKWEAGDNIGVTSMLTLLEILVKPKRQGNVQAVKDYIELITTFPNLQLWGLSVPIADKAADLRVQYNLKTPDALQIATALMHGATGFITNDTGLRRVTDLTVLLLDDAV